jgi:Xaa-Pro dipeptidase
VLGFIDTNVHLSLYGGQNDRFESLVRYQPRQDEIVYGEFGIRLEDCLYITETGAKFFSQPSPAIDRPFA